MDEAGGLTLRVLGEVDAIRDGVAIDLGGRRQRASLAALIIARGDVVSAERLAECVWGDDGGARGAGGLHSYVSHLRRRLQPDADARSRTDVITRVGRGYALCVAPAAVDAWRFEHLLAGVGGPACLGAGPRSCAPRWTSGVVRPTRSTRTSRGRRPRSPGSPSCGRSPVIG